MEQPKKRCKVARYVEDEEEMLKRLKAEREMEVELDAREEERLKRLKTQREMETACYQRRRYKAEIAYWAWSATLPELGEIMPNGEPACSRGKGWSASGPEDFPRCPEVLMQFKRLLEGS